MSVDLFARLQYTHNCFAKWPDVVENFADPPPPKKKKKGSQPFQREILECLNLLMKLVE